MEDQRAAAEGFAEQLRDLRTAVGDPSFRKMAGRSGRISHTTLHEAAAGTRFPSWETTREFVRACEADEAEWRRRWEDAQRPATVHTVPAGALTPVVTDSVAVVVTDVAAAEKSPAASSELAPMDQSALRAADHTQAADETTGTRQRRLPWLVAAAAVAAMFVVLGIAVRGHSAPDGSGAAASPSSAPAPSPAKSSDTLVPGDSSKFIADVTIPDGTKVKVNARFVKVWAIANVGTVAWQNRYLAPMIPSADDDGCRVPDRVAIGDTPPGEQVMISVPVTAPSRPGKCWVPWKMVDEHGRAFFPSRRPVYFLVTVTA
ncbi:NBR1-Ig-like domain-containing protein [Actinoplanes sp. NPDC049118]|uniref:NBR1-Ig-like domain-containing protein n=1 Tax=Actinoplanes sp. NPDC049118 TaxID=3155769 RepID=UPI0033E2009C